MIKIVSLPGCVQCEIARMLCDKQNLEYEVLYDEKEDSNDFPVVYVDGERLGYHDFLYWYNEKFK